MLKARTERREGRHRRTRICQCLGAQPEKIYEFQRDKVPNDVEDGRLHDVVSAAGDAGSDDDDDDDLHFELGSSEALEDQFRRLEEEVATLVADVHDLDSLHRF